MSEKKKLRVLVVPSDTSGCSFFRNTKPHVTLEEMYPDEFTVDIDYQPNLDDDNFLRQYDIIQYHRTLGNYETMGQLTQKLEDMGIVSIMDIDDYWELSRSHPAFLLVKEHGLDKKILNNVKVAKNVTTTTTIFAKEIEKYNKNVYVVPNAIDPKEKQYIPNPEPSKRIRIGFLGGSSHLVDLQNLTGVATKLRSDNLLDKVQMVLCGFDLRGTMTVIDQVTKQQTQRPIKPHESVWYEYEKIFTDNYKIVSPEYKEFLLSFKNEEYPNVENEPYRRVWTKPVSTYASNYNLIDISLAPLEENIFNSKKSELKLVESGFHKKAIIAQNFGPYKIGSINAIKFGGEIDPNGNCILVDANKNHKDWYKAIKRLILEPELLEMIKTNLHRDITAKYSMSVVTSQRRDLYHKLVLDLKNKNQQKN